jgi:MFS superfamily sulfate permease-like transporter
LKKNIAKKFSLLSWGLLLWASIIGLQLSSYKLYDEEYKKVTIRVCLVIVAFFVALFAGLLIGVILAIALLATLWGLNEIMMNGTILTASRQTEIQQIFNAPCMPSCMKYP